MVKMWSASNGDPGTFPGIFCSRRRGEWPSSSDPSTGITHQLVSHDYHVAAGIEKGNLANWTGTCFGGISNVSTGDVFDPLMAQRSTSSLTNKPGSMS